VGLLMQVDLDAHIPPQLYVAIAELLAWLYELDTNEGVVRRFKPSLSPANQG
jgi:flagellar biosynthesis protein